MGGVIGAGIAGLAAARTLAQQFDRVLVVDRDELSEDSGDLSKVGT